MMRYRLLLLLPLLAAHSGCAMLGSYSKGEQQINQWVAEREYGQALKALGRVDPRDPDYRQAADKRKQVEALAASYEHEVRQETNLLLDEGRWAEALDTFDEALSRLPESAVLKDGLAKLHQQQEQELHQLELKRLLERGNWLKQTLPTYQDIARINPRSSGAQRNLERMQREAEDVADELALHGNKALANHNLQQAEKLLGLAAELSDAPAIAESLKKLNEQLTEQKQQSRTEQERRRKQQIAAERQQRQVIQSLTQKFESAFNKKDFVRARAHLQSLADARLDTVRYHQLQNKLDQASDKEAARQFELGVNAYSRGLFEKAAGHWRTVLTLQPENQQAQEHLDRAERVLKKLKQLKEKQQN